MRDVRHFIIVTFLTATIASCGYDTQNVTDPIPTATSARVRRDVVAAATIVVSNSAELSAALSPANAGSHIRVLAGDYSVTQPLTVPDQATLEGEGVMLFDGAGLPSGFEASTRTRLIMTANTPGNVLTLGNEVTVRGIAVQDLAGRVGNPIAVMSRDAGDQVFATITEVEITSPNPHTVAPSGPTGCAVVAMTQNPNLGSDPAPHAGATIGSSITRSVIRSSETGVGCGLFAFNFAPLSSVTLTLADNVIGGGIIGNGGVSRPDAVYDSRVEIESHRNLYRNDSPNLCAPQRFGWNVQGGSGVPAPLQVAGTQRNTFRIHSSKDRIEGFTTGILATGGRRFFGIPTAGATSHNHADLQLIGTTISTPSCGGASFVADFRLSGATASGTSLIPGDGNTLRAVIRGVTGSGSRANVFGHVLGSAGPVAPEIEGTGNRLEISGNLKAFTRTNDAIAPAPASQFFTSGK